MYRNSFDGGDGWNHEPRVVRVGDRCPICGGPRGEPAPYSFWEDGEAVVVDRWDNPCGHVDKYEDLWLESQALKVTKQG